MQQFHGRLITALPVWPWPSTSRSSAGGTAGFRGTGGRLDVQDLAGDLHPAGAGERGGAGQALVQNHAHGEEIGALVARLAKRLLRRHVARRALHHVLAFQRLGFAATVQIVSGVGGQSLGQSEIDDLDPTVAIHANIRRLDIAVHDAARMGFDKTAGNLMAISTARSTGIGPPCIKSVSGWPPSTSSSTTM